MGRTPHSTLLPNWVTTPAPPLVQRATGWDNVELVGRDTDKELRKSFSLKNKLEFEN